MADTPELLPWVLIRKGKPPWRFATLGRARGLYNALRWGRGGVDEDAAVFGPGGEAWYCPRWRSATWVRDDGRRKREETAEPGAAA